MVIYFEIKFIFIWLVDEIRIIIVLDSVNVKLILVNVNCIGWSLVDLLYENM